jgi:putative oxidoreductase
VLRRLYSTFAGSWPGIGLLLMRLVVGSVLLLRAGSKLWNDETLQTIITSAPLAGSGLLLIAGLWTPLAGAVAAVIVVWEVLTLNQDPLVGLLAGTITGALAMLGPGRWSVDAELFGWKRIEAPPRRSSSNAL